jgi:hypothetical protein
MADGDADRLATGVDDEVSAAAGGLAVGHEVRHLNQAPHDFYMQIFNTDMGILPSIGHKPILVAGSDPDRYGQSQTK